MNSRRVVIVTHTLCIGGAERHISNIANYLSKQNIDVEILLLDNHNIAYELENNINVRFIGDNKNSISMTEKIKSKYYNFFNKSKSSYYEFYLYIKLTYSQNVIRYINNNDIIVSFMPIPSFASFIANSKLKNRLVFFEFSDPNVEYNTTEKKLLLKNYVEYSDVGIFQTEDEMRYYDFVDNIKKVIIPNPLYSSLLPEPFCGDRKKVIVNFCRIAPAKNLRLLVDAFELLHNEYDDYKLHIYGDGNEKEKLRLYINEKKLNDCIVLYDACVDVHKYIRDSAMFVSSSNWEGISNSMIEAMAIGLPCICTDCTGGGARTMIEDHENGILVPMNDKEKMCKAMKEIIENPSLGKELSNNAVKIRDRLNPDKICSQIMDAIFEE